jgi:hypothetical protein
LQTRVRAALPLDCRMSSLPCPNAEIATKAAETSPSLLCLPLISGIWPASAAAAAGDRNVEEWLHTEAQLSKMRMNAS